MKNKILNITKMTLLTILVFMLAVGCTKDAGPSSTGKNTSSSGNVGNQKQGYSSDQLEKNIVSSGAVSELGKLIVFLQNNNKAAVDIELEAEFYDAKGTIVGSDSGTLTAVGEKGEAALEMWSTPENFDSYKIYVDAKESDSISYTNQLEINHSNSGDRIAVQVKNNSKDTIEYIGVVVVYYQGDKAVGIDSGLEDDVKSGRSANFNLDFPYNRRYDNVSFDSYKVFVNEAYSYILK